MDYAKKGKTGTLKLDAVKARQLGTGIGQSQYGMMATGAYRMKCVNETMPAAQRRVAPASSTAKPAIPPSYDVCAAHVTPSEDTQEPYED